MGTIYETLFIALAFYVISNMIEKRINVFKYTRDATNPVYPKGTLMDTYEKITEQSKKWSKARKYYGTQNESDKKEEEKSMKNWKYFEKQYLYMIQSNIDVMNGKIKLEEFSEDVDIMHPYPD